MALYKNILTEDERQAVSIFFETTGEFKTVEDDNENYEKILQVLEGNSEGVGEYADNEYAEGRLEVLVNPFANLAETLTSLTDRVTYSDYMVYFDNEPVDSEIADIIIRSVKAGDSKVGALVNFLEKLYSQATSTARRNLFRWISDRNITLHPSGDFIAYKGLESFVDDGETKFRSVFSGKAYVNNKLQNGQIVQGAGDVVTMPPSMVEENEDVACSTGLHAGTYQYASGWHRGGFFTVLINPANVVSVPKDSNGQKVRVSRYTILEATEKEYTEPVWEDEDYYDDEEFEDSDEYWGDDADDDDWVDVDDDDDADYYSDYADTGYNEDSVDDEDDDTESVKSFAEAAEINSPYTGGEKVLTFTYHGRERVVVVEHVEEDRVFGESIADESFGGPAPVKTFAVAKMSGVGIADLYDAYSAGLIDEDVYEKYEDITAEANRQSSWENHPSNFVVGDTGDGFGNSVDTDDTEDNDSDDGISEDEYQELRESVVNLVRKFGDNTAEAVGRITGVDASRFDFQGWAEKVEKKGDEFTEKFSEALRDITRRDADED